MSEPGEIEPCDPEDVAHYIEVWKQTVSVQQHFNEIEWRIRGLALTAATFALGAAAVAAKDGDAFAATLVLVIGLLLWFSFYFVDRYWYHPLLIGSVLHGHKVEDVLRGSLPHADLARSISNASPVDRPFLVRWFTFGNNAAGERRRPTQLHSSEKLTWFYGFGAAALLLAATGLCLGALVMKDQPAKDPIVVRIQRGPGEGQATSTPPTPTTPPDERSGTRSRVPSPIGTHPGQPRPTSATPSVREAGDG